VALVDVIWQCPLDVMPVTVTLSEAAAVLVRDATITRALSPSGILVVRFAVKASSAAAYPCCACAGSLGPVSAYRSRPRSTGRADDYSQVGAIGRGIEHSLRPDHGVSALQNAWGLHGGRADSVRYRGPRGIIG
jgi:hypothetical protein